MLKLRDLRKKRGLTMKELGAKFGMAESTISQYETGKRQPDYNILLKFSKFFGVSVDYILTGIEEKQPTPIDGGGLSDDDLQEEFTRWFRLQSPERKKEVLLELLEMVIERDE